LLFICSISYAQSKDQSDIGREGTLFFKDKTEQKGFIKLDKKNHIWFRKTKDDDEVLYNFNDVTKFNTITNKGTLRNYHYELVPSGSKTKVVLIDEEKDTGTLFFKDNTTKKGIITFKKNNIYFKESEADEEKVYTFDKVYKLSVHNNKGDIDDYEYKLIVDENRTKVYLLKVKIIGKVSLFAEEINGHDPGMPMMSMNNGLVTTTFMGGGGPITIIKYYLSKENDMYAMRIPIPNTKNYHFRKNIAPEYFSNCKDLMEKLNSKSFDKEDFEGIVKYFNDKCQ
jgi:hypothetical protein